MRLEQSLKAWEKTFKNWSQRFETLLWAAWIKRRDSRRPEGVYCHTDSNEKLQTTANVEN